MAKLRLLVIEDSPTVRAHLVDTLSSDPELEVVGEAEDGKQGIELCERLKPDVVTCDMMMPVMTGLAATEYIMAYCPTPILIVSASTNRGELFRTYEALAAGALDALEKPTGDEPEGVWERKLIATVKLLSRIRVITHPRARLASLGQRSLAAPPAHVTAVRDERLRVIAIGVSTGGPSALVQILRALPATFPIPILVVLHIGKAFAPAFAEWLDGQSPLRVAYATDGQPLPRLEQSGVVLAPADRHLVLRGGLLRLTQDPERHSCRPSVDELFSSLAVELGARAVGCLLTGMGRDGAAGLLAMRGAGAATIAQDERTSVVFGMPREAILLGAAERVLGLDAIAGALLALSEGGRRT